MLIVCSYGHTEHSALDFSTEDGKGGVLAGKKRANVRSAYIIDINVITRFECEIYTGDRTQQYVSLDMFIDPIILRMTQG
jgi:hypothetical protein